MFAKFALFCQINRSHDVQLRTLTEHHDLEKINSLWSYRSPNSMALFQQIAKHNSNIGAFRKDGTLVAWMFRYVLNLILTSIEYKVHSLSSRRNFRKMS